VAGIPKNNLNLSRMRYCSFCYII